MGISVKQSGAVVLLVLAISAGFSPGEATTSRYAISFDRQSQLTHETLMHPRNFGPILTSTGDGQGWFYYPASDRYIMWFYNGPYSTNHITEFHMSTFVASVDFSRTTSYDISMGWTTPAWINSSAPPMPSDMPTLDQERSLIAERSYASGDSLILGEATIEQNRRSKTTNYNPAWVFVSASGQNLMLFRWLEHETVPKRRANSGGGSSSPPFVLVDTGNSGQAPNGGVDVVTDNQPTVSPPAIPQAVAKSPYSQLSTLFSQPADVANTAFARISGWGVLSDYSMGPIMADDWVSGGSQSIKGFRWWGLFSSWTQSTPPSQKPVGFHIGIWSDNPDVDFPATLLWDTTVTYWTWAYSGHLSDAWGQAGVESVFEFTSLLSQGDWFHPSPVAGTKYWISISAVYSQISSQPFNWMARQNQGTSSAVVVQQIGSTLPGQVAQWPPTVGVAFLTGAPVNSPTGVPWDMAYELISSGRTGGVAPGGDLNGDGVLDVKDISILMGLWID